MKSYFESASDFVLSKLGSSEHAFLSFFGESTQFIRINGSKVRQIGAVDDFVIQLSLVLELEMGGLKKGNYRTTLSGDWKEDQERLKDLLKALRDEVAQLPVDPYAQLPKNTGSSSSEKKGRLLPMEGASEALLARTSSLDLVGLYAAGKIFRGLANSAGQRHWLSTENFIFDYSIYSKNQKAIKGCLSGNDWNPEHYQNEIEQSHKKLRVLENPIRTIQRGGYRTYIQPAALAELVHMLSWGGVSEASIQQGDSPLRLLRSGQKSFSPLFSLSEDYRQVEAARFNSEGELAAEMMPIIESGKLINSCVSSRSSIEYGVASNGSDADEKLRAPSIGPGRLSEDLALERLHTGLAISNFHYLNWSDQPAGRITGMTRFACFWVENGKLIAPIENLRFDDTLFHMLGDHLEDLTQTRKYLPEVSTYGMRSLGGISLPGALMSKIEFTL